MGRRSGTDGPGRNHRGERPRAGDPAIGDNPFGPDMLGDGLLGDGRSRGDDAGDEPRRRGAGNPGRRSGPGRRSAAAAGGFRAGGIRVGGFRINILADLIPGGRLTDRRLFGIAAISHLVFFILTWQSLNALLVGQQAVAWMVLLTVLTGLVLWVNWLVGLRLAARPAGGLGRVLASIYVGLHGFLTLMLFLMWGFSLLGVVLSLPFADPPTRIDLPFAPPS